MRYIASLLGVMVAIGPAYAVDHQARIGEIMLSKNGTTANQFIEIQDPGETFPGNPYRLEIYTATGSMVANSPFDLGDVTPNGGTLTRLFVGTAGAKTAFGITSTYTLNATLPADGQVCFVNVSNTKIHCVYWGCVTTPIVGNNNSRSPAPPDGQSAQLQSSGLYLLAAPTPNAANATTGISGPACPTDPPDAGPFADDIGPIDGPSGSPDAGNNNNNGDGDGCCSTERGNVAGTFALALFVVLSVSSSRRRRRL